MGGAYSAMDGPREDHIYSATEGPGRQIILLILQYDRERAVKFIGVQNT